eukprot:m.158059 g.158059  ORF g.158059 m.158059 type:complete len:785 (-) comp31076_c0_seq4:413-2767(-)
MADYSTTFNPKPAMQSAAREVAEMLKFPESLDKLDQIRQRTANKKSAVETRLKTTVQSQLDDVRQGMNTLAEAIENIGAVDQNLQDVRQSFDGCKQLQTYTGDVSRLSRARDDLRTTLDQIDSIFTVPEVVASLKTDIDSLNERKLNVLEVYDRITKLEACRDSLILMMKNDNNNVGLKTIELYFAQVAVLAAQFSQHLYLELQTPLELIKAGEGMRLVSWLRIIEREERADEQRKTLGVKPKKIKKQFFDKLSMWILTVFEEQTFVQGSQTSMSAFLQKFDSFYFSDLQLVKAELQPRFPPSYKIFDFYLDEYHNTLHSMVDNLAKDDSIDPSEIMKLLKWLPQYKKNMKELGVNVIQRFENQLLDTKGDGEAALREKYITMVEGKLHTWGANMVMVEVAPWMQDGDDDEDESLLPNQNLNNKFYTETPKVLFQMIDAQMDVAFEPGQHAHFVMQLLDLCMKSLERFVVDYSTAVDQCQKKYYPHTPAAQSSSTSSTSASLSPPQRPQSLEVYLMACINNCITISSDYIPTLRTKVKTTVQEDLQNYPLVNRPCERAIDGLAKIATKACNILVDIVMDDIKNFMKELLNPKWFRSKDTVNTIQTTLDDYHGDFEVGLHDDHTAMVFYGLWRRIVLGYVEALLQKRYVCKSSADREEFVKRLKREIYAFQERIEKYNQSELSFPSYSGVITAIAHIITASVSLVGVEWNNIRSEHSDVSIHHFAAILSFREDMTEKEIRKVISDQIIKKTELASLDPKTPRGSDVAFFANVKVDTTWDYRSAKK